MQDPQNIRVVVTNLLNIVRIKHTQKTLLTTKWDIDTSPEK